MFIEIFKGHYLTALTRGNLIIKKVFVHTRIESFVFITIDTMLTNSPLKNTDRTKGLVTLRTLQWLPGET